MKSPKRRKKQAERRRRRAATKAKGRRKVSSTQSTPSARVREDANPENPAKVAEKAGSPVPPSSKRWPSRWIKGLLMVVLVPIFVGVAATVISDHMNDERGPRPLEPFEGGAFPSNENDDREAHTDFSHSTSSRSYLRERSFTEFEDAILSAGDAEQQSQVVQQYYECRWIRDWRGILTTFPAELHPGIFLLTLLDGRTGKIFRVVVDALVEGFRPEDCLVLSGQIASVAEGMTIFIVESTVQMLDDVGCR